MKGGAGVNPEVSAQVLLDALPMATVVFRTTGQVIAATPSFWQTAGAAKPSIYPAALPAGSLSSALLASASGEGGDRGHQTYRSTEGDIRILWRSFPLEGGTTVVACLVPESKASAPTAARPTDRESRPSDDFPDPRATEVLLEQAVTTCRQKRLPLSVALLRMTHSNGQPLCHVDAELWNSIARKLRALCRMTDLLGASQSGDFLIILIGATLHQAKIVTRRIMTCFDEWTSVNTVFQHTEVRYVTWLPNDEKTGVARLLTALGLR